MMETTKLEFKGTSGDWVSKENIIYCNNEAVASAFTFTKRVDEDRLENESWLEMRRRTEPLRQDCFIEQQANAKLIAAAPDLLEALQTVYNKMNAQNYSENDFDLVEKAIEKALK